MRKIEKAIKERTKELAERKIVDRILAWSVGDFFYDNMPAVYPIDGADESFRYNGFCGANLSKQLVEECAKGGKIAVLLKPCDTYSFNQLVKEKHIPRENVYVIGVPCPGMADIEKIRSFGVRGITGMDEDKDSICVHTIYGDKTFKRGDVLLEKCETCKSKDFAAFDEIYEMDELHDTGKVDRFEVVEQIENLSPDQRYEFWRKELSQCIRCNACRNACPACNCVKCVFDNERSGFLSKVSSDTFEENMFHIIRAFHVAGRCTDCGECTRVCPQGIKLHILNRKIIKDINEFYGEYQAGADDSSPWPLVQYQQDDCEPDDAKGGGGHA